MTRNYQDRVFIEGLNTVRKMFCFISFNKVLIRHLKHVIFLLAISPKFFSGRTSDVNYPRFRFWFGSQNLKRRHNITNILTFNLKNYK